MSIRFAHEDHRADSKFDPEPSNGKQMSEDYHGSTTFNGTMGKSIQRTSAQFSISLWAKQ